MRELYEHELDELKSSFEDMRNLCFETLFKGVEFKKDVNLAGISLMSTQLGSAEKSLYHACEMLILRQQPVAADLEFLMRVLRQIPDLRRIGELSLNSAKIIQSASKAHKIELLSKMKELLFAMFEAFKKEDLKTLDELENAIDSCFKQIKSQIAKELENTPQNAHEWLEILMLSKYFEKIADHIVAMNY